MNLGYQIRRLFGTGVYIISYGTNRFAVFVKIRRNAQYPERLISRAVRICGSANQNQISLSFFVNSKKDRALVQASVHVPQHYNLDKYCCSHMTVE